MIVTCSVGDDWNASTLLVDTFAGATILSPLDNTFGAWTPPFPDTGLKIDTYLRSPSAALALPILAGAGLYAPDMILVSWLDPAGFISPSQFLAARIGLVLPPGALPTFEPIGEPLMTMMISSVSTLGGGTLFSSSFTLYSGVVAPDPIHHTIALGTSAAGVGSVDLSISSDQPVWEGSTIAVTATAGYSIVSPLDNAAGAWNPPAAGESADTYLSASTGVNNPADVFDADYSSALLTASWADPAPGSSATSFQAARIAFGVPSTGALTLTAGATTVEMGTITIVSRANNGSADQADTFTVYFEPGAANVEHELLAGPASDDAVSYDLIVRTPGDDWNAATLTIETFGGVTIASPDDNELGVWTPPFPDDGTTVDTYVRSPSAPLALPILLLPNYIPTFAMTTWIDTPGALAPTEFQAARIAIVPLEGMLPTFEPIGFAIAQIEIKSVTTNGGGTLFADSFTLYSGIDHPDPLTNALTLGDANASYGTVDLTVAGEDAIWASSTITVTTSNGYEMVSPLDNPEGEWNPPVSGATFDTYLSASAGASEAALVTNASFTETLATATWADALPAASPVSFQAARVGFRMPFDRVLSLTPHTGSQVVATVSVTSRASNGAPDATNTFTLYAVQRAASVEHDLIAGPSSGSAVAFDLIVRTPSDDDWNAATLTIEALRGVTIVSPDDNQLGVWTPPFPDDGTTVDTYVRSPSAALALPQLVFPAYTPTFAVTTWIDPPGFTAPPEFLASRIALVPVPGMLPTLDPVGDPIAQIEIASVSQNGGGTLFSDSFTIYSGTATSQITQTLSAGPSSGRLHAFDLNLSTDNGNHWTHSNLTITTSSPHVAIASPEDNAGGAWSPPAPDLGTAVDTYLRAPSNAPTFAPAGLAATYSSSSATASWMDEPLGSAPSSFLAARIALDTPLTPTLSAVGNIIATVTIESFSEVGGAEPRLATFHVYDGVTNDAATHTLAIGPSAGDDHALNLTISTASGNPWARANVTVTTTGATTIVSPLDNAGGEWAPPVPDSGVTVDTYLRSPSDAPTFAPAELTATFDDHSAEASWSDDPLGDAPSSFLGARIALHTPGVTPTFSAIGSAIATITVESYTLVGGAEATTNHYTIYDGVTPQVEHTLSAAPNDGAIYTFDLTMRTLPDYDWNSGILTVATLGSARIVSPLDNDGGAWSPPYPDDGLRLDTYVRAPSNTPRFKPQRLRGTFTDTLLDVEWDDVQTAVAPPEFLGARIALSVPLGIVPTLEPIGGVIATVHIESSQTGTGVLSIDDFEIYDGIGADVVSHVLVPGPTDGDLASFDLYIATASTNDWNLSMLALNTFTGVTIVAPDDNDFGPWTPPFPDAGTDVDTYVRAPSNAPTYFPNLILPMYSPTSAVVNWYDVPGATAPQSFLGARLALHAPGALPTLERRGSRIATLDIASTSQDGGGAVFTDSFEVFDGVAPRLTLTCVPHEGSFRVQARVRGGRAGTTVMLDIDGGRTKTLTLSSKGAVNANWVRVDPGTHTVTLTLDSGQTVSADVVCQ